MRTTKLLPWVIANGAGVLLFYFGFVCEPGVEGARNVFRFLVWVTFFLSFALLNEEFKRKVREKGRAVPVWVEGTYDVVMTAALIWYGLWFTGTAFVFAALLQHAAHHEPTAKTPA